MTFFKCEKVSIVDSALESLLFAAFPSLVPVLAFYVPSTVQPFINVLQDTFGVTPERAPMLGMGYLMMLVAWVSGSQTVGRITAKVCVPTVDEVAEFKRRIQNKQAQKDLKESKRT
jgi:hypothetical protein